MAWYHKLVDKYVHFLRKNCLGIVILWIMLTGLGVFLAPKFMHNTTSSISAPTSSDAHKATAALEREFPELSQQFSMILVIRDTQGRDLSTLPQMGTFTQELVATTQASVHNSSLAGIVSFWTVLAASQNTLKTIATQFLSEKRDVTFVSISIIDDDDGDALMDEVSTNAHKLLSDLDPNHELTLQVTGKAAFFNDIQEGATKDLEFVDGIALPIALIVLGFVLRSIRLIVMPLISIACAVAVSFSLMLGVSHTINVISVTPSLMMSLNIALSIDYNLFLFSRFIEELKQGKSCSAAMSKSLWTAGETILVSGSTLAICFLGLTMLPLTLLQTMGIGAGCAVVTSMFVSLTFIPSIVFLFPTFFGGALNNNIFECFRRKSTQELRSEPLFLTESLTSPERDAMETLSKSYWYKLTKFTINHRWAVISLLTATAIPFLWLAVVMETSLEITLSVPRTAESVHGYHTLSDNFGAGHIAPYRLLLVDSENTQGSAVTEQFFSEAQRVVEAILTVPDTNEGDLMGLVVFNSSLISYEQFQHAIAAPSSSELDATIPFLYSVYVNSQQTAQNVDIRLDFDPYSAQGKTWLTRARAAIANLDSPLQIHLADGASVNIDGIDLVYKLLPIEMAVTAVIVFLLMALAFRSVIVPLRSISSIALTLAWTYGLATLTYNKGMLDWMNFAALGEYDGVSWFTPVMCFSVLTGFGLDYDIFLLTRIVEFRMQGFTDEASIKLAVFKTGGIITAAGCIMAIAFGGLLLSSMPLLNMCAFFITFSVLFDTFVVRTVLVPAAMAILGSWNFWPRALPIATLDEGVAAFASRRSFLSP